MASSFPRLKTPGKAPFDEIRVYRLPSNHFHRENELQIRVPHIELPLTPSNRITISVLASNVLLSR